MPRPSPCSATACWDDADWLKRYARNAAGEPIPDDLIQAMIAARQPFRAFNERQIALVAYFERDLYAMAERASAPRRRVGAGSPPGNARSWGWRARARCRPFRTS